MSSAPDVTASHVPSASVSRGQFGRSMSAFLLPAFVCAAGLCADAQPALSAPNAGTSQATQDPLMAGFQSPGEAAHPRVWWHWMNGNITWQGAREDMDWMKRVGIAGMQAFDAGQATLQVVDRRLPYRSPGWNQVFRNVANYADKVGLEFGTASSPGWSETGGPWVPAEDAMKKMAWSATPVTGGQGFHGKLAEPPRTSGMFQTSTFGGILGGRAPGQNPPELYVDQKVIAFRVPDDSVLPDPKVTSSSGSISAAEVAALSDGDIQTPAYDLPAARDVGGIAWIRWDFGQPVTIRGLTLSTPLWAAFYDGLKPVLRNGSPPTEFRLEMSDDGNAWRNTGAQVQTGMPARTISVDSVKARYFQLVSVRPATPPPHALHRFERPQAPIPDAIPFTELSLTADPVVHSFEAKAAFTSNMAYYQLPSGTHGSFAAKPQDVVDLTGRMKADGTLDWAPPKGQWMVLRMGYSLTGAMNRPASPEATGLEVDKLDPAAVKRYEDHYLAMYRDASGGDMGRHGLHAMMFDSWEASFANWTPNIINDFKRLRGYDPTPWLPALAGYVIDTPERSDGFLWDWRRTIQQLLKVNHYEQLTAMLHSIGMIRYGEAHEEIYATMGDGMEMKESADVPMGAMWEEMTPGVIESGYFTDDTESASVAHIYGQNIAAAESLTGGPRFGSVPWGLKPTADAEMIAGINRFVIHTSTHQPVDKGPGMTLGVGQYFTRNETWAEQAKPWIDYLSRACYLLQQGQAVSDVALFYGEAGPAIASYRDALPQVPAGYRYDFVNADVIINVLAMDGDAMATKTGMRYRVLYLGKDANRISLPVLKKMLELVRGGGVVVGERPEGSPSLVDDPAEVQAILNTLWPGEAVANVGKGKVFASGDLVEALPAIGVEPDFSYTGPEPDSQVLFIHRHLADGEIYYLSNRVDRADTIKTSFRVSGRVPELWDPATGKAKPVSYRIENGRTEINIPLDRFGSTFVVFRKPTNMIELTVQAPHGQTIAQVPGPWHVAFQANRGAPASAVFPELADFRDNSNAGIRYFSGIATYSNDLTVPALKPGHSLWLDLGTVYDIAEVWVNGKRAGTAWKPPYRVDISAVASPGRNRLEIKLVDKWVNRLIGDVQPGVTHKITFTAADGRVPDGMDPASFERSRRMPYAADAPLVPAGLIGPVTLDEQSSN